ncbi:hypothetical protein [Nonomuraea solani]|uniref:hypothetical protein n=1 Tax=Nonomuraea solani TaxID=1144553 RepID=UPI001F1E6E41|nr:hypothetical protein [Nonomuraea solani]
MIDWVAVHRRHLSGGWHITLGRQDVFSWKVKALVKVAGERPGGRRQPGPARHVGDPILESNRTRRIDFALFMVEALDNDELVHRAPAMVGRRTPSALAYASATPAP